jgi:putative ABC transport system permease protein
MVANMQCGFDVSLPTYLYAVVFGIIIVCYLLVSIFLMRKIKKITPAEALKNRE